MTGTALQGEAELMTCRWYNARQGSTMVGVASAAAAELRGGRPDLYPEVEHSWYRLEMVKLTAPLLCCECHRRLQPDGLHKACPYLALVVIVALHAWPSTLNASAMIGPSCILVSYHSSLAQSLSGMACPSLHTARWPALGMCPPAHQACLSQSKLSNAPSMALTGIRFAQGSCALRSMLVECI